MANRKQPRPEARASSEVVGFLFAQTAENLIPPQRSAANGECVGERWDLPLGTPRLTVELQKGLLGGCHSRIIPPPLEFIWGLLEEVARDGATGCGEDYIS